MAGGLLIGMSLAAAVPAFPGPVVSSDHDQSTSVEAQTRRDFPAPSVPTPPSRSRCTKPKGVAMSTDEDLGTMGMGFNCDGAPRSKCPFAT